MPRWLSDEASLGLILRSPRSGRLEGWQQARAVGPSFETALRASSG